MKDRISLLIVDDEAVLARVIKECVESDTLEVACVSSVEKAKEMLQITSFDVILTDYRMPCGENGLDLCQWVSDSPEITAKVILMSFFFSELDLKRIRELSVSGVLPKPFGMDLLQENLQRILLTEYIPAA